MIFRVCLFRGKIGRMENVREKMNLGVVWLGGGEKKKNFCVGPRHFSPRPTNTSLQNAEKTLWLAV